MDSTPSPGLFDQGIVARPCRAGCREHVHVQELPFARDPLNNDLGGGKPSGWTAQGTPPPLERDDLMWFQCNACSELVSELDVEDHRCG